MNVAHNSIGTKGALDFAELLNNEHCFIRSLNLAFNSIEGVGARAIAEALKVNKTLLTLDISGNEAIALTNLPVIEVAGDGDGGGGEDEGGDDGEVDIKKGRNPPSQTHVPTSGIMEVRE